MHINKGINWYCCKILDYHRFVILEIEIKLIFRLRFYFLAKLSEMLRVDSFIKNEGFLKMQKQNKV